MRLENRQGTRNGRDEPRRNGDGFMLARGAACVRIGDLGELEHAVAGFPLLLMPTTEACA